MIKQEAPDKIFCTILFVNVSENGSDRLYSALYVYLEIIFAPNEIMTTREEESN